MKSTILQFCLFTITLICCNAQGTEPMPPTAKKEIIVFNEHGIKREDPYHWLNQRDNPEVLAYIAEENAYTALKTAVTKPLQDDLFHEFKSRIKQEESSLPFKDGAFYYYQRMVKDKDYPIYCRKNNLSSHQEEVLLDLNALSKNHDYYNIDSFDVSPDDRLLAFTEDKIGRRQYKIKFKELRTGKILSEVLENTSDSFEWSSDSQFLFYIKKEPITLRAYRVYRHQLGTPNSQDVLVYEEKDPAYYLHLYKTKSKKYISIISSNTESSETWLLEANKPRDAFRLFSPRQENVLYGVEHRHHQFIIRTNENAQNYKIMQTSENKTAKEHWQELVPHQDNVLIEEFQIFNDYLALLLRNDGLMQIEIHPFDGRPAHQIDFDEPCYYAYFDRNREMSSHELRFTFTSLKTPSSIYDYDMKTRKKVLKKQAEIGNQYKSSLYHTERVFAKAQDGTLIPISLVYRKEKFQLGQNPLFIEGYGAYGITYDCIFDPYIVSLLDRGFVYAIAHVRGGSDMGKPWHDEGKLLNKKNSFTDFIEATEYLTKQGYVAPDKRYASGVSAGGLLMGGVLVMRPDLFDGMIIKVPFLDLINTMQNPDIPLTANEFVEWGDPKDKTYYDYMLSYSPYDNIRKQNYPNLLVISAYQDSQVQYWEPTKYVARMRANKTDDNLLLLQTLMQASHGGVSGRENKYKQFAFEYAFLLHLAEQS